MLGENDEKDPKESFRDLVTSLNFLKLSVVRQQAEIASSLAKGLISEADWDEIKSQSERNLRVVSLNVGYNVMSNIAEGSEAPFVRRCQTFYPRPPWGRPDLAGWARYEEGNPITNCALNSAEFLVNFNLFGLQEVNPNFQREFSEVIRETGRNNDKDFEFYDNNYSGRPATNTIVMGYDRNVMGQGLVITPQNYGFGHPNNRGVLHAVYFPLRNVLFVNLRAPPGIDDLKIHLDRAFEDVRQNLLASWPAVTFRNLRVIVVGDFNDCAGTLLNYSNSGKFKILGRPLILHVRPVGLGQYVYALRNVERTCCFPEYRCYGDYIFDSFPVESKLYYFGPPIDYQREVDLYSDHDPVIMVELDDLTNKLVRGEIVQSNGDEGQEHIGIAFKNLDRDMLYDIARLFLRRQGIPWSISKPLSWVRHNAFPHVSLNEKTYPALRGKISAKVNVTLKELLYWDIQRDREGRQISEDRWVAIAVVIHDKLICPHTCHISIGQQKVPLNRR